jgi:hypothetical protein
VAAFIAVARQTFPASNALPKKQYAGVSIAPAYDLPMVSAGWAVAKR